MDKITKRILGDELYKIIRTIEGKGFVSEYEIAELINKDINSTRHLLYELSHHNLVSSKKEKDKTRGWYIYYWRFHKERLGGFLIRRLKERLERLNESLKREEENTFFVCEECKIKFTFDQALNFNFKCPECGSVLIEEDKEKEMERIREEINKVKDEINKVKEIIKEEEEREKEVLEKKEKAMGKKEKREKKEKGKRKKSEKIRRKEKVEEKRKRGKKGKKEKKVKKKEKNEVEGRKRKRGKGRKAKTKKGVGKGTKKKNTRKREESAVKKSKGKEKEKRKVGKSKGKSGMKKKEKGKKKKGLLNKIMRRLREL